MRTIRVFSFLLVIFCSLFVKGNAFAKDMPIPNPVGDIYVQDFANVLSEAERAELRNWGREVENRTTAQIAVLTVDTIEDYSIEEYSNEAFRKYRLGSQKENNGVLLVLAMNDRKVRIEVGYGLEGRLPDGKVGRILDEYTFPLLQKQQPNQAIIQTYKVLINETLQEYGLDGQEFFSQNHATGPQPPEISGGNSGFGIPTWLIILIVVVLIFLDFKFFGGTLTYFILSLLSRGGGRGGGGGGGGPRGGGGGSSGGGGASRGW